MTTVTCTSCGKAYPVQEEVLGKRVKCKCGAVFRAAPGSPAGQTPRAENTAAESQLLVCTNTACGKKYRLKNPKADLNGLQCAVCHAPLLPQAEPPPVPAAPPAPNWDDLLPTGLSTTDKNRLKDLFQREAEGWPATSDELEERCKLVAKSLQRAPTTCPSCGTFLTSRVGCSACKLHFATGLRKKMVAQEHPLIAKARKEIEEKEKQAAGQQSAGGGGKVAGDIITDVLISLLGG
ncbi:MAG: hypothetical protein FJ276_16820 [Planctomycetes bacterium]|nr:hypothetical protein [Planctomycetota bacterium]